MHSWLHALQTIFTYHVVHERYVWSSLSHLHSATFGTARFQFYWSKGPCGVRNLASTCTYTRTVGSCNKNGWVLTPGSHYDTGTCTYLYVYMYMPLPSPSYSTWACLPPWPVQEGAWWEAQEGLVVWRCGLSTRRPTGGCTTLILRRRRPPGRGRPVLTSSLSLLQVGSFTFSTL